MKLNISIVMALLLFSSIASADTGKVPNVLAYQSILYDDGGNPIADGDADIIFRITDHEGALLFEESQRVDVVRGAVSVLVGNGDDLDGAPTGGIPLNLFQTENPLYLEVEVEGFPATDPLEIVSVPYAIYAGSVAEGGVNSKAIRDRSIVYEDLSDSLIKKLGNEGGLISREGVDAIYREPAAASKIGVQRGFNYSGANDLQGVLSDLDRAVKRREEKITSLLGASSNLEVALSAETQDRINADNSHKNKSSNVHGLGSGDGAVVGTNKGQTLRNKTLDGVTLDGAVHFSGGSVITGDLNLSESSGDFIAHDHSGEGSGGSLYPNAIWFDAGTRGHLQTVSVGHGFGSGSCRAMVGLSQAGSNFSIAGLNASYVWEGDSIKIYCINGTGAQCTASYSIMCARGM
ncbi:MAG: hypothetical protein HN337_04000 [Deltaproteobacteria bacterium]|jgi:hypothetical protein|nr:hypothetical protein [Deltaproteobacteria bacterium]